MYSLKSRWLWLAFGMAGLGLMCYFCLVPRVPHFLWVLETSLPGGLRDGDKSLHFLMYLFATLYAVQIFRRRHHLAVALVLVMIGGVIECLQGPEIKRRPEVFDFMSNIAGAGLGWYLAGLGLSRFLRLAEFHFRSFVRSFRKSARFSPS